MSFLDYRRSSPIVSPSSTRAMLSSETSPLSERQVLGRVLETNHPRPLDHVGRAVYDRHHREFFGKCRETSWTKTSRTLSDDMGRNRRLRPPTAGRELSSTLCGRSRLSS